VLVTLSLADSPLEHSLPGNPQSTGSAKHVLFSVMIRIPSLWPKSHTGQSRVNRSLSNNNSNLDLYHPIQLFATPAREDSPSNCD
jgi:hypothetical protein